MSDFKAIERNKDIGSNHSLLMKGLVPGIIYGKGTEPVSYTHLTLPTIRTV